MVIDPVLRRHPARHPTSDASLQVPADVTDGGIVAVPRVAAVIPSWNTMHYLQQCLASVAAQDDVEVEVMVVDNGSEDDTPGWLRRNDVPHRVLTHNVGFARAVNLGAMLTQAPLVLVLNADCVLEAGCLAQMVAALDCDPKLGGVQPLIVQDVTGDEPARVYSRGQCLTTGGNAYESGWGEPVNRREARLCEVFGVSGAACLLRRELFSQLGGYDEFYFAFYEDVDLNARARLAGWRFACISEGLARHTGHVAWRQHPQARSFNARLTTQNRIATAVKVLPAQGLPVMVATTLRQILTSFYHRTTGAVLTGIAGAIRQLPRLLRERRRLRRAGPTSTLDAWLVRRTAANPMLAAVVPQGGRSGRARDALSRAARRARSRG
jgi:N-acetylglucosaminyl-diphospho-decaprenol L-rhamnosyltransferase